MIYFFVFINNYSQKIQKQLVLIAITTILLLSLLFIGGANVSTLRETLFDDGLPSSFGALSVAGLSCIIIFGAIGFSEIGKRISIMLNLHGQNT